MRLFVLLTTTVCLLTACGDDSKSTETAGGDLGFAASDMVGTWVGPCFEFTETTWALDYSAYGDDACSAAFLTVDIAGDYTLEGASEVAENSREGTFGFTTKTVTPHVDAAVGVINGACEVMNAEVGVALDIAGGCAGLGAYPIADCSADYDIVRMNDDGTLAFGARPADNNMCTADNRPTTFEGGAVVTRQ